MRSPFDDLGKNREPEDYEEVEGAFSCQERDCYYVVTTAKYISSHHIVTWQCPDGHLSKAKMNLDD